MSSPSWALVQQRDGLYLFRRTPNPATTSRAWRFFWADAGALVADVRAANRGRKSVTRHLAEKTGWSDRGR